MRHSRYRAARLVLGLVLLIPPLIAAPQGTGYENYRLSHGQMTRAIQLLAEGKLNDAKGLFEKCTRQVAGHYEAHFYLAQLAYSNKDFSSALEHIQTAIHSLEELERFYNQQSTESRKRLAESKESFQHIVDQITQASEGGSGGCKAAVLIEANHSVREMENAASSPFGPERPFAVPAVFHFVRGNCLLRLKRNAEARDQYAKAIQLDPNRADAWNNLTYLWFIDRDLGNALATIRQADTKGITIKPDLKEAILAAAQKRDAN